MVRSGYELWRDWSDGLLDGSRLSERDWVLLVQYLYQSGRSVREVSGLLGLDEERVREYLEVGVGDWVGDLRAEREKDVARLEQLYQAWSAAALEDPGAARVVMKVLELRARLLGLDKVSALEDPHVARWREAADVLRVVDTSEDSGKDKGTGTEG